MKFLIINTHNIHTHILTTYRLTLIEACEVGKGSQAVHVRLFVLVSALLTDSCIETVGVQFCGDRVAERQIQDTRILIRLNAGFSRYVCNPVVTTRIMKGSDKSIMILMIPQNECTILGKGSPLENSVSC